MPDAVLDNIRVPAPLHISARLMAALRVENAGACHLHFIGYDREEGRAQYHYVVTDENNQVIHEGTDFWSGAGHPPVDYLRTMESLLSFLLHYAEEYQHDMEGDSFHEWCYLHSEELEIAQFDLQEVTA